jgi:hypothetical protein
MSGKLIDLNNHLFAQLERLGDENLSDEKLEKEASRTDAIVKLSEQIIGNAQIALNAAALVAKHGCGNWENMLPGVEGKPKPPGVPDFSEKGRK